MLEDKVLEIIKKYNMIESGDRIVIGVSGGPDSICLLNVLNNISKKHLSFDIVACHINHCLRKNAILDEEYAQEFCKKENIPFFVKRIDIGMKMAEDKIGTEEAGRKARYEFFNEVLEKTKSKKIATAHNLNDNSETVIMNILRGSGISGLKGIELRNEKVIRPLLYISREEIEEYCKQENLNPRYDESNMENIYTRNKVRNVVIPYIKKNFNPNIIETVNRLSNIAKEEDAYIESLVKKEFEIIKIEESEDKVVLDLKKFNNLELVIKRRVIIYTVSKLFESSFGIEKIHLEDIIKLCSNNIGNKFLTPNKNIKVLVKNKTISITKI